MINVIGLGYIGLPTALMLSAHGQEIIGTDCNEERVARLNAGKVTFDEEGLEDTRIENRVVPMMTVLVSGFFESYEQICNEKKTEALYQYLKLYHARSKLILLVTDGRHRPEDEKAAEEALKPFLGKKLVSVLVREDGMELG